MRDSTVLYRNQVDGLRGLPPDQFKAAILAIIDYELDEKIPEGDTIAVMAFNMAKPLIDKRNRSRENGAKGGRPKTQSKPKHNPDITQSKPSDNPDKTDPNPKEKGERRNIKDNKDILSGDPTSEYPYKDVIGYLNEKAGTKFKDKSKDSRRHIKARFDEGFTLDDFYKVIDGRCAAWKGDAKMSEYLRPSTLFGTKFESYLNAKPGTKGGNAFNNFTGRDYDYESLEKMLTGVGS